MNKQDLNQYRRHVLMSLDTIMNWANEELPEDDLWGHIAGYGLMPANPELYRSDEWESGYFDKIVEDFIYEMYEEIPEDKAEHYESLLRKIPIKDL